MAALVDAAVLSCIDDVKRDVGKNSCCWSSHLISAEREKEDRKKGEKEEEKGASDDGDCRS